MEAVRYYEETMEAAGIKAYESRFKAAQIALKYSDSTGPVSYTHLRAHETVLDIVCRLLLEKKNYKI